MTHGRVEEAERELAEIEDAVRKSGQDARGRSTTAQAFELVPEKRSTATSRSCGLVFHTYPKRAVLGATLMITQSFLYNAIYFTYGLVLVKFYGVSARTRCRCTASRSRSATSAARSCSARSSTRVGRKPMISGTYIISGDVARDQRLAVRQGPRSTANSQTFCWVDHLLLRVSGGERRVPDRQRDVADRDPRRGDRGLLRDRADLRSVRAGVLRLADRRRPEHGPGSVHRLPRRSGDHDHRRDRRDRDRDQGRGEVARGRHETADVDGDQTNPRGKRRWRPRRR